jgi:hypothetical protein
MHYGTEAGIDIAGRGNILRLDCWEEGRMGESGSSFVVAWLSLTVVTWVTVTATVMGDAAFPPLSFFSPSLPPPSSPLPYIRFLSNIALTPAL